MPTSCWLNCLLNLTLPHWTHCVWTDLLLFEFFSLPFCHYLSSCFYTVRAKVIRRLVHQRVHDHQWDLIAHADRYWSQVSSTVTYLCHGCHQRVGYCGYRVNSIDLNFSALFALARVCFGSCCLALLMFSFLRSLLLLCIFFIAQFLFFFLRLHIDNFSVNLVSKKSITSEILLGTPLSHTYCKGWHQCYVTFIWQLYSCIWAIVSLGCSTWLNGLQCFMKATPLALLLFEFFVLCSSLADWLCSACRQILNNEKSNIDSKEEINICWQCNHRSWIIVTHSVFNTPGIHGWQIHSICIDIVVVLLKRIFLYTVVSYKKANNANTIDTHAK